MTDLDELDLFTDPDWPPPLVQEPKPCRHRRDQRTQWTDGLGQKGWTCVCGHVADPAKIRMGRNSNKNGKSLERREMRLAGRHTGPGQKADDGFSEDGLFAYQSKTRLTKSFPGWQSFELDKLRVAHPGKVPVLTLIEKPGAGRRPRMLAVLEWKDWLDLHGRTPDVLAE